MIEVVKNLNKTLVSCYNILGGFSFSKKMAEAADGINQGDLELTMMNAHGDSVRLRFFSIRNFEIKSGPFDEIRIVGLVVEDMTGDQWPGVHLKVSSEDDQTYLSFYCVSVDVID